ncbi:MULTISPECIES: helix-turn-helix transcriptional regulator [Paenibacillus]|uniref:AraC family transcriptional regulator n=1 Tax=Paenibacillus naphthalenovorans TaxID=162209 RepID=A0A0U2WFB1_9BACL|nr:MULTISPECIES: AraC family transcriptional regulator [Paenibacillus]ALS24026.1 AraC family transcriptional regulator [Paenibacillus naphthalenovorans]GCL72255.1 AraC family transcriptional regulator [Paenibacillus naphthalenovorans]
MTGNMREDHHEYLEIYFFTPSEFEKSGAAWPIRLGHNIAKPNYHIGPRTSPYYYLLFVLEGQGTFIQNHQTFRLKKNDMFCLFPQVIHEYYTDPDAPLRKIFFAFDGKQALHLLDRIGLRPHTPHAADALTPQSIQLMWEFYRLVSSHEHTDLARLRMFYSIFEELSGANIQPSAQDNRTVSWLQKGKEYLEIHYVEGITVERAAEFVGVDRTHYTKQFRKAYGVTPIQYIQQLRMKEAKQLIEQTNYTMTEIAQSVGYPDLFTFSKAFKKMVGVSPKEYRIKQSSRREENEDVLNFSI